MRNSCDYCGKPLNKNRVKQYTNGTFSCFSCWAKDVTRDTEKVKEVVKRRGEC